MLEELIRHTRVIDIVGDVCRVKARGVALADLAVIGHRFLVNQEMT